MKDLAWEISEQKTDNEELRNYCDGVGRMITPIKEQMEKMKSAIHQLKDAGDRSEFGSASSGSPDKEDRKKALGELRNLSSDALKEMQETIDHMGNGLRREFDSRFEEGDKNGKGPLKGHPTKSTSYRIKFTKD